MASRNLTKFWHFLCATFAGVLAARRKTTSHGWIDQFGDRARNGFKPLFVVAVKIYAGNGTNQTFGIGVCRRRKQFFDAGLFDNTTGIHHHNPLSRFGHHAHSVRDEHDGHAHLRFKLVQQIQNLRLNGHVQGGSRLIGNEQFGFARQGHGNHHPLTHTARELMGIVIDTLRRLGNIDQPQHVTGFGHCLLGCQAFVQPECLGNLLTHTQNRVE